MPATLPLNFEFSILMPVPPRRMPPAIWKALIEMPKKAKTPLPTNIETTMTTKAVKLATVVRRSDCATVSPPTRVRKVPIAGMLLATASRPSR